MLVPNDLRKQMIQRIHSTHIGADGCLRRARESIYWPGMTRDIKDHTAQCDVCRSFDNKQSKETLRSHVVTNRPWAKVGVDIRFLGNRSSRECQGENGDSEDEISIREVRSSRCVYVRQWPAVRVRGVS